jgi:hypothetical protein
MNNTTKLKPVLPDPFAPIKNATKWTVGLFTGSDIGLLLTIVGVFVIIGIGSTIGFEVILPNVRTQFANNVVAIIGGLAFMFIILQFAGQSVTIFGTEIDFGLVFYILILGGVVLAFSG